MFCFRRPNGGIWGINRSELEREREEGRRKEYLLFNVALAILGLDQAWVVKERVGAVGAQPLGAEKLLG